jgi:hypothetical protein
MNAKQQKLAKSPGNMLQVPINNQKIILYQFSGQYSSDPPATRPAPRSALGMAKLLMCFFRQKEMVLLQSGSSSVY